MQLKCFECGKVVSTEVSSTTMVRGILTCPECIEKEHNSTSGKAQKITQRNIIPGIVGALILCVIGGLLISMGWIEQDLLFSSLGVTCIFLSGVLCGGSI